MNNSANKIFKIMSKAGVNTISELIILTVKSLSPLVLTDGDKLNVTQEFCIWHSSINKSNININDAFIVLTFNDGQTYYITEGLKTKNEIMSYNIKLNSLQNSLNSLERRVKALENKV